MRKEAPAIQGEGGNAKTAHVAGMLQRLRLNEAEAFDVLCEFNQRCVPRWDETIDEGPDSLRRLLRNVYAREGGTASPRVKPADANNPRPVAKPSFGAGVAEVAETFAAGVECDVETWRNASDSNRCLRLLYLPGEIVNIVKSAKQEGIKWRPDGNGYTVGVDTFGGGPSYMAALRNPNVEAGAWMRPNPVKPGTLGSCDGDMASFRFVVMESDAIPRPLQLRVLWRLRSLGLSVAALVDSGARSFHAWVRVDAPNAEAYREIAGRLLSLPLGFDKANRNPSRLSRFPGAQRGGAIQEFVFINGEVKALDESTLAQIEAVVSTAQGEVPTAAVDTPPLSEVVEIDSLLAKLDARRIRLNPQPVRPIPVLSLGTQPIATAGNLTLLAAQAKSGKSAALSAALSALLVGPQDEIALSEQSDCLGWNASGHDGRALVLVDTEQSTFDAWHLVKRAADRAGLDELPQNLRAYGLVDLGYQERRQALLLELERANMECGGICAVLLDGVADFVADVNDAMESNGFVEELMQLAARYACPFLLVLHENPLSPSSTGAKMRGHLGSQVERKAESILRLDKDPDGVVTIWGHPLRHGELPKAKGICFAWSDQYQRHVTVEGRRASAAKPKKAGLPELLELVPFSGSILKETLASLAKDIGIADKPFRDFVRQALDAGNLHEWSLPRLGSRPFVKLARYAQPKEEPTSEEAPK